MIPAPPRAVSSSAEAWDIMREDVTLRQSLMTPGFNEQRQRDLGEVGFEDQQKGNSGYYFPARVELEIRDTNERAQALFQACCEVWEIHGYTRNRAFYRAVFDNCLEPLFATRRATVTAQLQHRDQIKRTPGGSSAAVGSLARRMDQLRATWSQKLEKEARDSDTGERVALQRAAVHNVHPTMETAKPRMKASAKKLTRPETQRRSVIFGAIQCNLKGIEYCKELDSRRLHVPHAWSEDGCPSTYVAAYSADDRRWRKRIQDEKKRYGKKYGQASPTQRESIIQELPGTRHTRQ